MEYIWLALLVLSALIEALTVKILFAVFVPASLVAMILAFCNVSPWIQLAVFAALTVIGFLFRPLAKRLLPVKEAQPYTVEAAIGTRSVVVERLDNLAGRGAITVFGMEWAARTVSDDVVLEAGTEVEIIAVEGVKFICRAVL
ncbi:MAG: NfeD family protein [Clostridia bacterium]|nr:NfeD family protein [Clostridia bacterium]